MTVSHTLLAFHGLGSFEKCWSVFRGLSLGWGSSDAFLMIGRGLRVWEEEHRGEAPPPPITSGALPSTWPTTAIDLDPAAEVVLARILPVQLLPPPQLCALWEGAAVHSPHLTRGGGPLLEGGGSA